MIEAERAETARVNEMVKECISQAGALANNSTMREFASTTQAILPLNSSVEPPPKISNGLSDIEASFTGR
jgi:hypothetical protein